MSVEGNKALVRRFYAEIDKGNLAAMDELVAEDYLSHDPPPFPDLPPGRAGPKRAFELFWRATPGYHVIEDQIAEDDKVVARLRGVGQHEGEIFGIPSDGQCSRCQSGGDSSNREWPAGGTSVHDRHGRPSATTWRDQAAASRNLTAHQASRSPRRRTGRHGG